MMGPAASAPMLSCWWQATVALSAVFVVYASLADNRSLAFATLALCAALITHAFATIAEERV
jgi:hypothetical protein